MAGKITGPGDYLAGGVDNFDVAIRKDHLGQHHIVGFRYGLFFFQLLHICAGNRFGGRTQQLVLTRIEDTRGRIVNEQRKHDQRQRQHPGVPNSQSGAN